MVAFVAAQAGGQSIYIGRNASTSLINVTSDFVRPSTSFDPAVQLNKPSLGENPTVEVVGRRSIAAAPGVPARWFLERYTVDATTGARLSRDVVASAGGASDPYSTIFPYPAINDQPDGATVYAARRGSTNVLVAGGIERTTDLPVRPVISNDGQVVARAGGGS